MSENSTQDHAIPFYRDERTLKIIAQVVSTIIVVGFLAWAVTNFLSASEARGLNLTYDFLELEAGFPISDPGEMEYDPSMSYLRAFQIGLYNTLRVSLVGIVLAVTIGTLLALARLSPNWLLSKMAWIYVEFHRNIPLLVLLFLWYSAVFTKFPKIKEAKQSLGFAYFTNRGWFFTWPRLTETGNVFIIFLVIGVVLAIIAYSKLRKRRAITGQETYFLPISLAILILFPLVGWFAAGGTPFYLDIPIQGNFNFEGGKKFTPEYLGVFVAITLYTAAFMAEVVRAGIMAVDRGQVEAARAVGLKGGQVLSLIIMPQALRVIIPPMISQFLNLTKNTSLALAIGYQDVFSVGKIAINQSGRAVPVFSLIMLTYLSLSLIVSIILNQYNKRIQFVTR